MFLQLYMMFFSSLGRLTLTLAFIIDNNLLFHFEYRINLHRIKPLLEHPFCVRSVALLVVFCYNCLWISMPRSFSYWNGFPMTPLHMQQLFVVWFYRFNSSQLQPSLANSPHIIALFTCSFK